MIKKQAEITVRIGVDFDNTIICYDNVFHKVAVEQGLIPESFPASKTEIKNYLCRAGRENVWTRVQGYVYGPQIQDARIFPGVMDFFRFCKENKLPVFIISHKTRYPYLGPEYDLHQAAVGWLEQNGFFDSNDAVLERNRVFLELSIESKIERIKKIGCTHFIDDLPETFSSQSFPAGTLRILFGAERSNCSGVSDLCFSTWEQIITDFKKRLMSCSFYE